MSKRYLILTLFALLLSLARAHETQTVGEGDDRYKVIVGYATEPPFTEERNGLYLGVLRADDRPVENLQNSLTAELVAPNGEDTLGLELRAVHGEPGVYTDDFVLTEPGVYTLRVTGFIGATMVDLTYELHEVRPIGELRFP